MRSKTIEWHAPFSSCSSSPYEVIDSDLEADMPRVAYKFLKRSKGCQYEVMEIVGKRDGYWSIRGYPRADDYQQRRDDPTAFDSCPVEPMPSQRCNLPFATQSR
ncbi:MAG: hypothetical protein J7549_18765 [Variovorax sp.]|nr:hypothetical protein [Variovorax sp.]